MQLIFFGDVGWESTKSMAARPILFLSIAGYMKKKIQPLDFKFNSVILVLNSISPTKIN